MSNGENWSRRNEVVAVTTIPSGFEALGTGIQELYRVWRAGNGGAYLWS